MAKNTYKSNTFKKSDSKKKSPKFNFNIGFLKDRRLHLAFGFFLLSSSIFLFTAFISYLFTGKADMSVLQSAYENGIKASGAEMDNWLGLLGAQSAYYFVFKWFGLAAFLIPPFLFLAGYKITFQKEIFSIRRAFTFMVFFLFWASLLLGFMVFESGKITAFSFLCGGIGYELAVLFNSLFGWGTYLVLILSLLIFMVFYFDVTSLFSSNPSEIMDEEEEVEKNNVSVDEVNKPEKEEVFDKKENKVDKDDDESFDDASTWTVTEQKPKKSPQKEELTMEVENTLENKVISEPEIESEVKDQDFEVEESAFDEKLGKKVENYDPTLDLSSYKYPILDLLEDHNSGKVKVTQEELEANKDKILETLTNFKIKIQSIKATIGPTVTLYEIVPEAGVKISKIKNLEDDIALSLAALGIRIIAPIPGKGTIGIEVPNKNREMVSMKSVLATDKFLKSDKELPIILGKTISNDVFIADLAKMPHLLMAGATGQGKSVGLNVMLASLIYKKHPSQLKFVLVDPKKVELTLFNKLERHFLAMLPNEEEPIITDTKKVVNTLNSLCIEMDNRYDLLKDAGCRNLKEYNNKFVNRKLNPEKGHRFLPYIVLVIDELADLMMTAGKEVETPIARLAQLARAIGIHLVVATQRPSVNVITGIIKANFPARLSFRVTSKIDSRTILDTGGSEQLVGMGDMLLSQGSDLIRLQCPFIDTPEIDEVVEFIGNQRGYEQAYQLPEFSGDDDNSKVGEVDLSERDALFDEAARLIVMHQQGSTSLIQRKLKLGYNRAGRLIDQLEAAGIVGAFEGSKAREVLIPDEYSLEQLLNNIDNNN
ncbi:FtsK/SpoIIIE family DNA translocase [Marivirga arenosa]|uniref:DNA translocase FtsK 4TM domain-containing protein n=1 Tax=Marivirga arenosa TaxID=3059076 RepID=A0AA52EXU3_9BACT|nr:DNA translocase FtsK 4TM domain-containing protein [Marivirga sp. BKB1-2]WNB17736.1 DNA translocase FtsK 4TM domain-containing protein [Marivirga sp. BKB1-2]